MTKKRVELGERGEKIAAEYLIGLGCAILEKRYRGGRKEIDLIARDGRTIIFVEVKTDTTGAFGPPEGWVTPRKQAAIVEAARHYILDHPSADCDYRFDVVGVKILGSDKTEITHLPGAFVAQN